MDRDIACCVGVDLASAILVTLQELPPGTDYIVRRWPVDPRTGRVIATRVRDVDVNASRIANGQPFGGSPFGSIMIDVTLDADVARVSANGVASGVPTTDIHVITTMSLVWRGTMYDPEDIPAPSPPPAPALENFRLRGQPRIAWGAIGASASINGLPGWLGPGHVVPPVVPALTWPDECAIGAWQTEVYNAPDDIGADLGNLFSAALIKLVAGIIDGPRLMANALGPAGAKAVTLDLQGRQLYITAIGWSPVDGAVDPVTATRRVWRSLGIGWADDTPWTAPYRLWLSPALLLRATRLTVGKDAVREEAAEGVTADMLRLWPAPYTDATPMPWLRWSLGALGAHLCRTARLRWASTRRGAAPRRSHGTAGFAGPRGSCRALRRRGAGPGEVACAVPAAGASPPPAARVVTAYFPIALRYGAPTRRAVRRVQPRTVRTPPHVAGSGGSSRSQRCPRPPTR